MSNFSGAHFNSSGCESGWTTYLEESFDSESHIFRRGLEDYGHQEQQQEDEEGDLSMVSDASSGPPTGFDHDGGLSFHGHYHSLRDSPASKSAVMISKSNEIKKKKKNREIGWNQHSYLDDTASSPVFGFSKKEMDSHSYSQVENLQGNSRKQHQAEKQPSLFHSSTAKISSRDSNYLG